jgi:hypothetical protein
MRKTDLTSINITQSKDVVPFSSFYSMAFVVFNAYIKILKIKMVIKKQLRIIIIDADREKSSFFTEICTKINLLTEMTTIDIRVN